MSGASALRNRCHWYPHQMAARYPYTALARDFSKYIRLEGEVLSETECISRAEELASLRVQGAAPPSDDTSWGWLLGIVGLLVGPSTLAAVPLSVFELSLLSLTAAGLLAAWLQIRPLTLALGERVAVRWRWLSSDTDDQSACRSPNEHSDTSERVAVFYGRTAMRDCELWALCNLPSVTPSLKQELRQGRERQLARITSRLLPDIGGHAVGLLVGVLCFVALRLVGTNHILLIFLTAAVGRILSSAWHAISSWRSARRQWAALVFKERVAIALGSGAPYSVVSELATEGPLFEKAFEQSFLTAEAYRTSQARANDAASVSPLLGGDTLVR